MKRARGDAVDLDTAGPSVIEPLDAVGRKHDEAKGRHAPPLGETAQPVLALDECVAALSAEAQPPGTTGGTGTPTA